MTDRPQTNGDDSHDAFTDGLARRTFVALGAGASVTALAGCSGEDAPASTDGSGGSDGSDGGDGSNTLTGSFRLLVSDAPADIGDFDRLDVTLEAARLFEAESGDDGDEDEEDAENEDGDEQTADDEQGGNESDTQNDTDAGADGGDVEGENGEDNDANEGGNADGEGGDRGFTVIDLDGATVDLTRVIGDDATAVFDGEIPAGSYEKIAVDVSETEGVVDGETVDVKLPSEKLQITNSFEVTPEEPVSFVFDINVVKRGRTNGYILTPVISGSGVAGRDVKVNEVDDDDDDSEGDADGNETESTDGGDGNETESADGDNAENGTASGIDS
ncbi:DUF4382 domain-containing protein [Halorubrum sp. BV1]|uniref:DUF4382 domain-containing protein n=1 Tax=Halorubrum sp. BV1 TaxID=1498500 RepID=UPI000678E30F|nr:DUF4382 domain-containing protein [Halorubrum sp. BV1]